MNQLLCKLMAFIVFFSLFAFIFSPLEYNTKAETGDPALVIMFSPASVRVGDTVDITVYLASANDRYLSELDFTLVFPNELVPVSQPDPFEIRGEFVYIWDSSQRYFLMSQEDLSAMTPRLIGDFIPLMTITFRVDDAGGGTLDAFLDNVYASDFFPLSQPATLYVTSPVPIGALYVTIAEPQTGEPVPSSIVSMQGAGVDANLEYRNEAGMPAASTFNERTIYTAHLSLSPQYGFVWPDPLPPIEVNDIIHTGTLGFADQIDIAITFDLTDSADLPVSLLNLTNIIPTPAYGEAPVASIDTSEFTGTVEWLDQNGSPITNLTTFGERTAYTARVFLFAREGYTFELLNAGSFTHSSATSVLFNVALCEVLIMFPETGDAPVYGVELLPADGYDWGRINTHNLGDAPEYIITITSTGNMPINGLSAALGMGGGSPFEITNNLPSNTLTAANGSNPAANIHISPKTTLEPGVHLDELLIIWDNDQNGIAVNLRIEVTAPVNAGPPVILSGSPEDGIADWGADFELFVEAESIDGGTLAYQWYRNTSASADGSVLINGATSSRYSVETDAEGVLYYFVVVTNTIQDNEDGGIKQASETSRFARVEVLPQPTEPVVTHVNVNPAAAAVAVGGTHTFTAVVSGLNDPPQDVTWRVEGSISDETTISDYGELTVAADEAAQMLTVRAVSAANHLVNGTANVTVTRDSITPLVTVMFIGNGGTPTSQSVIIEAGAVLGALLPSASRNGYSFREWNMASDGMGAVLTGNTAIDNDITVYAIWTAIRPQESPRPTEAPPFTPVPTNVPGGGSGQAAETPPHTPAQPSGTPSPSTAQQTTTASLINISTSSFGVTLSSAGAANIALPLSSLPGIIEVSGGTVSFNLSHIPGVKSVSVGGDVIAALGEAGVSLEIAFQSGAITFGSSALSGLMAGATGGSVTIALAQPDTDSLTAEQLGAIGQNPAFELTVHNGSRYVSHFAGSVGVQVQLEPQPGQNSFSSAVIHVAGDGATRTMRDSYYDVTTGSFIFTTSHFSVFMIAYNPAGFTDIDDIFEQRDILQQAAKGLVRGYDDSTFRPNEPITRAEFIEFICNALDLRMARFPGYFVYNDVVEGEWYHEPIGAAKQAGILSGFADNGGDFRPHDPITRREAAVILSNIAEFRRVQPVMAISAVDFSDHYVIGSQYTSAVEQAVNAGFFNIYNMRNNRFAPLEQVTRAQAVEIQIAVLRALGRLR